MQTTLLWPPHILLHHPAMLILLPAAIFWTSSIGTSGDPSRWSLQVIQLASSMASLAFHPAAAFLCIIHSRLCSVSFTLLLQEPPPHAPHSITTCLLRFHLSTNQPRQYSIQQGHQPPRVPVSGLRGRLTWLLLRAGTLSIKPAPRIEASKTSILSDQFHYHPNYSLVNESFLILV